MDLNQYGGLFAEVYNLFWTEFIDIVAPQIISLYKSYEVANKTSKVLDLCCGTGRMSHYLLKAGFNVTGIDKSPHMLKIAKRRNVEYLEKKKAEFIENDATSFVLNQKFGLVVSTFDSLNHLDNMKQLGSTFQKVYDVLEKEGLFVFDINTEKGLKTWEFIDIDSTEEAVYIIQGVYDPKKRRAYSKVFGFFEVESGCFKRFDEVMSNTVFPLEEVELLLQKTGFENVFYTKEEELQTIIEYPEKEDRVFVIAQK